MNPSAPSRPRLESIDILRGFVMVLMMLDHTRDYFHYGKPTDLAYTTPVLFFTRWITHLCAPTFVFLAGTAAYLRGTRGHDKADSARFLLVRGFWLIFLEFTIVHWAMGQSFFLGQVIWIIGASMICMAGLIYLPLWAVGAFGLIGCLGHNLLDGKDLGYFAALHEWTVFKLGSSRVMLAYPLIPWVCVMAAGYATGPIFRWDSRKRITWLLVAGVSFWLSFLALRWGNFYGDPHPWQPQASAAYSVISFLNVHKYPPSLLYLLALLGISAFLLVAIELWPKLPLRRFLLVFGQVPLFYYLLQWITARGMGWIAGKVLGRQMPSMDDPQFDPSKMGTIGLPLWATYVAWIIGVAALYPLCRWFCELRKRRRDWWLSYL